MDKDSVKGQAKKLGGKAQEALGRATGDEETEARGKARQGEGVVQKAAGDIKDKAKDVADKIRGK